MVGFGHSVRCFGVADRLLEIVLMMVFISLLMAGCRHGRSLEQGHSLYSRGEYGESLAAFEDALAARPDSVEAAAGAAAARRQIVKELIVSGDAAMDHGDFIDALGYYDRASVLPGSYPELADFRDQLIQRTVEHADREVHHDNYSYALSIYDYFRRSSVGEMYAFDEKYGDVAGRWASLLYGSGLEVLGDEHFAYALLLFSKAAELVQDERYLQERENVWQKVWPTLRYQVRVNRVLGGADGELAAWSGPAFVSGSGGLVQIRGTIDADSADATILVDELTPTIQHRESTSIAQEEYQSGTRDVLNPEYDRLDRKLRSVEHRLLDAEKDVTDRQANVSRLQLALEKARQREREGSDDRSRQALRELEAGHRDLERSYQDLKSRQNDVQDVHRRLRRTSRTVPEAVYSLYEYPVITHVSYGSIGVEYVIKHADGREAIRHSSIRELQVSDYEHGNHPVIGIGTKYLELPADAVLEDRLMRMATDQIMTGAGDSFDSHRAMIRERALQTADTSEKIDDLVRYLLLSGRSRHPALEKLIDDVVGIPEAQSVLSSLN